MEKTYAKLTIIKKQSSGYWGERITSQIEYALRLFKVLKASEVNIEKFENIISNAVNFLENEIKNQDAITKNSAQIAEGMISCITGLAKKYKIICTAHAHIDMNWKWNYAETVALTLDTFRTMLNLMKEYPDFTFSQSQASVYRIVEEYDPEMLDEIRKRVKEGRWEVTASTWVETDKNMPSGESLARHILYTKKYLSDLMGMKPESLKIDFEPDTFGHSRNIPEILNGGGVKFFYHCRPYAGDNIYRWIAPSGKCVISYRDHYCYNYRIASDMVMGAPEFCNKYGIDTSLRLYGVGDHGGGPTRRDIEKLIDMASWPVFPVIRFGTYIEFFNILRKNEKNFPVAEGETNFIFTGCYTTQTRIKMANRISEAKLNEAECFGTLASILTDYRYRYDVIRDAWKKTLFNQFHDILPGSGVVDTREYAMGQFQQVLAKTNTETVRAMGAIASVIDTSMLLVDDQSNLRNSESEGAGVGYGIKDFMLPQAERGKGLRRIYHLFNSSPYERVEPVIITVWDWPGDRSRMIFSKPDGSRLKYQIIDSGDGNSANSVYWHHKYIQMLVIATLPACGYSTCILDESENAVMPPFYFGGPRIWNQPPYVLENDNIRVEFNSENASIQSFIDKKTGKEMIDISKLSGIFRLVEEDDSKDMTAWIVGRYKNAINLNSKNVKINKAVLRKDIIRQTISYDILFGSSSKLSVTASLDSGSSIIRYDVSCDWQERPVKGGYIPQLNFHIPLGYGCSGYRYDIPFGTIDRKGIDDDVPANSWALGIPESGHGKGMALFSCGKHGYRGIRDSISLTLIRSSYDPDPYPEIGIHNFWFAFGIVDASSNKEIIETAYRLNHPIWHITGTVHDGTLPAEKECLAVEEGSVAVSSVKMAENQTERKMILRVYETEGKNTLCRIKLDFSIKTVYFVDLNENRQNIADADKTGNIEIIGNIIRFEVGGSSVVSIAVELMGG